MGVLWQMGSPQLISITKLMIWYQFQHHNWNMFFSAPVLSQLLCLAFAGSVDVVDAVQQWSAHCPWVYSCLLQNYETRALLLYLHLSLSHNFLVHFLWLSHSVLLIDCVTQLSYIPVSPAWQESKDRQHTLTLETRTDQESVFNPYLYHNACSDTAVIHLMQLRFQLFTGTKFSQTDNL